MKIQNNIICEPCATGKPGYHNEDSEFCEIGMLKNLDFLPKQEAIDRLRIIKMIPTELATTIVNLAIERKRNIYNILQDEGQL
jgi:hypothetical protein